MVVTYTRADGQDQQISLSDEKVLEIVHLALSAAAARVHKEHDACATFFNEIVDNYARDIHLQ